MYSLRRSRETISTIYKSPNATRCMNTRVTIYINPAASVQSDRDP